MRTEFTSALLANIWTSSRNSLKRNYCGGEWVGEWRLKELHFQGKVQINTHYFEEGNVQLKKTQDFKFVLTNQKDPVDQIASFIKKADD